MSTLFIEVPAMDDYTRGTVGIVDEPEGESNTSSNSMSTLSIEVPLMVDCTRGTVGTVDEPVVEPSTTRIAV